MVAFLFFIVWYIIRRYIIQKNIWYIIQIRAAVYYTRGKQNKIKIKI